MNSERLDIVLFGATGYTGKFIIESLSKVSQMGNEKITFGIAGRSAKKLNDTLDEVKKRSPDLILNNIPIILADANNYISLREMAKKAKLIINASGPYWLIGEPVVKACIDEGTHHIDISAEPNFIEMVALKYHDAAQKKGVYVINSCGFDSVPSEIGVLYLQDKFPGTLNSIEVYQRGEFSKSKNRGPIANITTLESALYLLANLRKLYTIHTDLYKNKLPKLEPRLELKLLPHSRPHVHGVSALIPGPDLCSLYKSQRYFFEKKKKRPIQIKLYGSVESYWDMTLVLFVGFIILLLSQFGVGRKLVLKYPAFFTNGVFDTKEVSLKTAEETKFITTFLGKGWKNIICDINHTSPTDQNIVGQVSGRNAGYGTTAMCAALCAKTILTEKNKLPQEGGTYSPAAAFAETSLMSQLQNTNTMEFKILSITDE